MAQPHALYILSPASYEMIYGPDERADLSKLARFAHPPQTAETVKASPSLLADIEVIFSGWGAPMLDAQFLASAPKLKAFFYGAGSVRKFVSDEFWNRDILLSSAYHANAIPVAEFTLAQIILALKHGLRRALHARDHRERGSDIPTIGCYGATVGIISLGMIGRHVVKLLKAFDTKIIAYDPFITPDMAKELNVELCPLDDIFRRADVVSLHTPWLKETERMITGAHLRSMKPNTTFINTARGAIVCEEQMIEVLQERPDLMAFLDVTYPHEPPLPDSPLWTLRNVVLTPHIAGSTGNECRRMGRYMVNEFKRYLAGQPLEWQITREKAAILA